MASSAIRNYVRCLPILLVCAVSSLPGCGQQPTRDPPEDFIAYNLHAESLQTSSGERTEIRVGETFDVVCTFYSAEPIRTKVLVKVLRLNASGNLTIMDSGAAEVSGGEKNRYECRVEIQGMKTAGIYIAQVHYGRKIVDVATIDVVAEASK